VVVALCLTSAAAFAPVASHAAPKTVVKAFETELGVQPPLGFFDPLGLLADADQEKFERLRYVEIKHGRISMLAVLGQIVTKAGIFLPGTIDYSGTKFSDVPTGFGAFSAIQPAGIAQIVAFVGFLELFVMKDSANGAAPGEFPGDFRNGALDFGWDSFSAEEKLSKRAIELNNGRAAMMGILALMVHEELGVVVALCLTSAAAFAPVASHAAPKTVVKAFETELGVQPPLGFFDPLGLLADADQEKFERLRYVEIKHGRISMLAVLGQIVTKAGIFLPGTIDYSGTKFSDVPTGFGAFSAIQPAGIAQIVAFVGFLELFVMKDSANGAAPGEFPGDFRNGALDFGWDSFSAEEKLSKRAIELNNGRAAMMGILALMVHEELGVVVALCLTSAAAFAPVASHAAPKTVVKAFETELGVQPPLGFFDPLGLLADADQEKFERLRYVEIKHGRISMLAVLGQIVTKAGIFLPGTIDYSGTKFSDVPTGFGAFSAIQPAGIAQIVAFVGFLELFVMKDSANGAAPGEFPGDFRNGALDFGWDSFSAEEKLSKRAIELNNGRAAMMGILALMVHEELGVVVALCLTSAAAFAPVASHAAPKTVVKAFETELGVQPPLGFFDPLGLLADADQEKFERLRYVEIKHGRISMLAVLGQIVTKAGIFLPGTIDYSGTKFSDVPTGFGAFSAIQPAGIAQIVAFVGFLELFVMKDSANGAAPGEFPGDFRNGALDFGWDSFSAEEKLSKRAIELNNGRAAMMGILALMVHEEL
ncbi:hypothetical protein CTAYLR_009767, partial [Chrysophaeum taylorii]